MADENEGTPPGDDDEQLNDAHLEVIEDIMATVENDDALDEQDMKRLEVARVRLEVDKVQLLAELVGEVRQLRISYRNALKKEAK